ELLAELQNESGLTYLCITHDLAVVRQLAHRVAVMQKGKIVESGTTSQIFDQPENDYTRQLLSAISGATLVKTASTSSAHGRRPMKFLLLTPITHTPDPVTGTKSSTHDRLRQVIDNAVLAEELGYDGYAVGERHEVPFIS